jgi:hypothetical protein
MRAAKFLRLPGVAAPAASWKNRFGRKTGMDMIDVLLVLGLITAVHFLGGKSGRSASPVPVKTDARNERGEKPPKSV